MKRGGRKSRPVRPVVARKPQMPGGPSNEQPHGNHSRDRGSDNHGNAEQLSSINKALVSLKEAYNTNNKNNSDRDARRFRTEIAVAVGLFLYTLFTFGLLIASLSQLKASWAQVRLSHDQVAASQQQVTESQRQVIASQQQLAAMADNETRQLRSYVGVIPGDVEGFGEPGKTKITFTRKNYGITPAYDVGFSTVFVHIFKPPFTITEYPAQGCGKPNINGLITMFPSAALPESVNDTDVFSASDIDAVRHGLSVLVAYGNVCYNDAFGHPHYTNYCWMYKGDSMSGRDADGCIQHNDSN